MKVKSFEGQSFKVYKKEHCIDVPSPRSFQKFRQSGEHYGDAREMEEKKEIK